MSRSIALPATCVQSVVKVDNFPVEIAEILSSGKAQSSGVLVMYGDKAFYITNVSGDIKTTIEKLISTITSLNDALTQIGTTLTSIGAGMTGPTTAPPPTLPTDVTAINAKVTELNAIKSDLNSLKEALK